MPPKKNSDKWWYVLFACLALLVIFISAITSGGGDPLSSSHDRIDAYVICKQFAAKRLLAPASAKWESGLDIRATPEADGKRYLVYAHVDAQNAYGTMVRQEMMCAVEWQGGSTWKLLGMDLR